MMLLMMMLLLLLLLMMMMMMMMVMMMMMMMMMMFTMSMIVPHWMNQDEEIALKAKIMILPQMFGRRSPIKGKGSTRCSKMMPHVHWKSMKKQKTIMYDIYIYIHNDSKTWWIFHVSSKECLFQCCKNIYIYAWCTNYWIKMPEMFVVNKILYCNLIGTLTTYLFEQYIFKIQYIITYIHIAHIYV